MVYGIRGISADRKTAVCKVTVDESNTVSIEDLQRLGYEFVSKEEFDGIEVSRDLPSGEESPYPTTEDRVAALEAENKTLKAQLDMQAQQYTFLEDCILEMGDVVYA